MLSVQPRQLSRQQLQHRKQRRQALTAAAVCRQPAHRCPLAAQQQGAAGRCATSRLLPAAALIAWAATRGRCGTGAAQAQLPLMRWAAAVGRHWMCPGAAAAAGPATTAGWMCQGQAALRRPGPMGPAGWAPTAGRQRRLCLGQCCMWAAPQTRGAWQVRLSIDWEDVAGRHLICSGEPIMVHMLDVAAHA